MKKSSSGDWAVLAALLATVFVPLSAVAFVLYLAWVLVDALATYLLK